MLKIKLLGSLFLLILSLCQTTDVKAQPRLGIEFSALWDSDWNDAFSTLFMKTAAKRMSPSIPIAGGLKGEYLFGKWAPYGKVQFLNRRMQMFRGPNPVGNLVYNTFELSIGTSFYQPINNHMKFFVAIGGGMDIVSSELSKLSSFYYTSPEITYPGGNVVPAQSATFSIVKRENFVWSATSRIGIENELGKWGGLQFWTELHLQFAHSYAYQLENQYGQFTTGGYRAHYGAAGISWILSFVKDKE